MKKLILSIFFSGVTLFGGSWAELAISKNNLLKIKKLIKKEEILAEALQIHFENNSSTPTIVSLKSSGLLDENFQESNLFGSTITITSTANSFEINSNITDGSVQPFVEDYYLDDKARDKTISPLTLSNDITISFDGVAQDVINKIKDIADGSDANATIVNAKADCSDTDKKCFVVINNSFTEYIYSGSAWSQNETLEKGNKVVSNLDDLQGTYGIIGQLAFEKDTGNVAIYVGGGNWSSMGNDSSGTKIKSVATSMHNTYYLTQNGDIYAFGYGMYWSNANESQKDILIPEKISNPYNVSSIKWKELENKGYGYNYPWNSSSCAIDTNDDAYCWGSYDDSMGDDGDEPNRVPSKVAGGYKWKMLSNGGTVNCGLTTDDNIYCWGYNWSGSIGDGLEASIKHPSQINLSVENGNWSYVSTTKYGSCGLTKDGKAYCWGKYMYACGNNMDGCGISPNEVNTTISGGGTIDNNYKAIFASTARSKPRICAIHTNDNTYCWGEGTNYILGNGSTDNHYGSSVEVSGNHEFESIAIGYDASCGLTTQGDIYCWGSQSGQAEGILGNGTNTDEETVPKKILDPSGEPNTKWKSISMSQYQACGISTNDELYCWGGGKYGILGNDSEENSLIPLKVLDPVN